MIESNYESDQIKEEQKIVKKPHTEIDQFIPFTLKNSFEKIYNLNNLDCFHKSNSPKLKSIKQNNKEVNQILIDYKKYYNKIDNGKNDNFRKKLVVSKSHNML